MLRYVSNNLGYAGSIDVQEKAKGETRIYVLGCSTTEQNDYEREEPYNPNETWPYLLEKNLQRFTIKPVVVINAAGGGYTSIESLIDFQIRGIYLKPDFAIFYHGINDVWFGQAISGFKTDYSHSRKIPVFPKKSIFPDMPKLFVYQYLKYKLLPKQDQMIHSIVKKLPFETDLTNLDSKVEVFKTNVRSFCAICIANRIVPVLIPMVFPALDDPQYIFLGHDFSEKSREGFKRLFEENNRALKEVAMEFTDALFIDPGKFEKSHFRSFDWIHWSKKGLVDFSSRVAEVLKNYISA